MKGCVTPRFPEAGGVTFALLLHFSVLLVSVQVVQQAGPEPEVRSVRPGRQQEA